MSIDVIRADLETRLANWAAAQTPVVLVSWEGRAFTKPNDGSVFVEPFLIPNDTINFELSGKRATLLGLFQVNCWAPKGQGMGPVTQLAKKVAALYPMLPKIGSVSIERTPHIDSPLEGDSNWIVSPVLMKYRYEQIS